MPLYWRAIPNDESLLEIGIDSVTHMISAITLPLVAPSRIREVSTAVVHVPIVREGVPIVDISPWGDDQATRFVDEAREFTVDLGEDGTVSILFNAGHASAVRSNSVSFLLDVDGQLTGMMFTDVPEFVVPALRARRAEAGE